VDCYLSTLRTISVFFKLLPIILALRKDRREWVKTEGKNVDVEKYRKNAKRILNTFISLGPVYIKLGQWLSSRADILPQPYLEELAKLQDDVPVTPFEKVKSIIEKELGPINQKFDSIEENALSGASLGQVYNAKINGQAVVVKVKRPGIERTVEEDLKVLKKILPIALKFVDPNLRFSASGMLAQFIETIYEEMDYTLESSNLKKIKENIAHYDNVIVPSVYDDHSSKSVLTMEYVPGIKITNVEALDAKGIDRQKLVIDVHKVFFTMLLRYSIFHADPHPGNISVSDDGSLILYDYGMVGRLDNETRLRLIRLYLALIEKDSPRTVNAMDDLGMLMPDFNRSVIERAIELTIRGMHGTKPSEMEVKALLEIANKTMSRFPFMLPKNLALYMRMTSIIEGIYKTHKVDFKFVNVLKKILEEENLIKDAYIEELKYSFQRFTKSIDATISIAPELKKLIDENRSLQLLNSKPKSNTLLSGSILSSAIFVSSAFLYSSNDVLGIIGMVGALIIMGIFTIFRKS
jgi:predicted unusual protein kinase regulating ubiquinone biosynthesis (AarF/ABC1/UbiB family)